LLVYNNVISTASVIQLLMV